MPMVKVALHFYSGINQKQATSASLRMITATVYNCIGCVVDYAKGCSCIDYNVNGATLGWAVYNLPRQS